MLTITDDILNTAKMSATQLQQEVAMFLYAKNKLSFGQARKLAGVDVLQFQELLFNNNIALHYGVADFEDDFKAIHEHDK
jgi:predicted HTH domain antitoxin